MTTESITLFNLLEGNYDIDEKIKYYLIRRVYKHGVVNEFNTLVNYYKRTYRKQIIIDRKYEWPKSSYYESKRADKMTRIMFLPTAPQEIYNPYRKYNPNLIHHTHMKPNIIHLLEINDIKFKKSHNRKQLVSLLLKNNVARGSY